jgi:hypothetical protein
MRVGDASAAESISGQLITFNLSAGEGAKCKPGQVLSVYDPADEADAHAIYITSIATDAITGINGYLGSPAVAGADSGDLDNAVFEQEPFVTGFEIFEAVDAVFAHLLYPWVYDITTGTIASPDLVDGQEAVAAAALEILGAWQIVGPTTWPIPYQRVPLDVDTTIASTGRLATFDWFDSSTGYYTYKEKLAEADEAGDELTHMIAVGAAAVILGAHLVETTLESSKKDNMEGVSQRQRVGSLLWRDFLTLRQNYSEELVRRIPQEIIINRG